MSKHTHTNPITGKALKATNLAVLDDAMHAVQMPQDARLAFANDALALRWGAEAAPITANVALQARRSSDTGADIWSTFNVLQETVMRGGQRYATTGNAGVTHHRRVRPLRGLGDQGRINRALWDEATAWHSALARAA